MFANILIANRGEIACRIIKTAHRLGIRCIAVYSDADRNALHTHLADESIYIGPSPAIQSYLNIEKIIAAARQSDAEAIHPGYGFLAESSDFAARCKKAGLIFIGPTAAAIAAMGSKSAAKQLMAKTGIPILPGYHGEEQSLQQLKQAAERVGYPLLIKPSAGGGGKGMHIVTTTDEFEAALHSARREAAAAFNDDKILIEKYLHKPRHIEVQIFTDQTNNGVYLFERDCSIQRRHQKIIEEAPAPGFNTVLREAIGATALKVAQAIDYIGAGTVEFLMDSNEQFYFMEMNTRLQVEHPVTEMITGLDLVEWQLRVAAGESLPLKQDELKLSGHAIEARIYAEDPDTHFLPDAGTLAHYREPKQNIRLRIDSGVREGDEISVYYDPLLAKLIVWHTDRDRAIRMLQQALHSFRIVGIKTNIAFLKRLIAHKAFYNADIDTAFIDRKQQDLLEINVDDKHFYFCCAAIYYFLESSAQNPVHHHSLWSRLHGWSLNSDNQSQFEFDDNSNTIRMYVKQINCEKQNTFIVSQAGFAPCSIEAQLNEDKLSIEHKDQSYIFYTARIKHSLFLFGKTDTLAFHRPNYNNNLQHHEKYSINLKAPMNGRISTVLVKPNQQVNKNAALIVLEAMKMEHTLKSPHDGCIETILCNPGDLVQAGTELLTFKTDEDSLCRRDTRIK